MNCEINTRYEHDDTPKTLADKVETRLRAALEGKA